MEATRTRSDRVSQSVDYTEQLRSTVPNPLTWAEIVAMGGDAELMDQFEVTCPPPSYTAARHKSVQRSIATPAAPSQEKYSEKTRKVDELCQRPAALSSSAPLQQQQLSVDGVSHLQNERVKHVAMSCVKAAGTFLVGTSMGVVSGIGSYLPMAMFDLSGTATAVVAGASLVMVTTLGLGEGAYRIYDEINCGTGQSPSEAMSAWRKGYPAATPHKMRKHGLAYTGVVPTKSDSRAILKSLGKQIS